MPCADATFDFAISVYGACLWADPHRWVAEAERLLRPGGQLVFLTNSFLLTLCEPAEDGQTAMARLLRRAFGMNRLEWPGDQGVEFHLSHGDWIRLLRRSGFEVEDLVEIHPAAGAFRVIDTSLLSGRVNGRARKFWKVRKRT
jgi:SAM-dependent methyltransferase